MGAEIEFELDPDGVLNAKMLAVVVVILQTNFRELARVEGQVRLNTGPLATENVE